MRYVKASVDRRTADGIVFRTIGEKEAYLGYCALQRDGKIRELQYEPTFSFEVNGVHICKYSPDFTYIDNSTNNVHVIDCKGWKVTKAGNKVPRVDREFGMKCKLMKALYSLEVEVV